MNPEAFHSTRQIRRRLIKLLLQAWGSVIAALLGLLLVIFGFYINQATHEERLLRPREALTLEAFYLGRGSWQGLADLPAENNWHAMLVLDAAGRVVLDHGQTDTPLIGQPYARQTVEARFDLHAGPNVVGQLVIAPEPMWAPVGLLIGLLTPITLASILLGLLTVVIGNLLGQRVVTPLADVISAARAVAGGELSARVPVRGPGDLRALTDSFNHMAESLERGDRERRALLADVAHELRTPLSVLRGRLEGIVDGIYPPDADHVAPALEETYLLERLVEDLRVLTLAESGQLHLERQALDLPALAERVVNLFEAEAVEKQIDLALTAAPGLPTVWADPQRVEQVLGNLVSNALRYVPAGGHVRVELRPAGERVETRVIDDGPGLPPEDLPRLFDRFWRGEKARSRAAGGAGLGLAIARQLVEAHGGGITASLPAGGGLMVTFMLPREEK